MKKAEETKTKRVTKKSRILAMYEQWERDVKKMASEVESTTSYVASVLQSKGSDVLPAYFDLYTSTGKVMNVYGTHFRGKMRFKDVPAAKRSVEVLQDAYTRFREERDWAGQHHTLGLALMMSHRALFGRKAEEAAVYRNWLLKKLAKMDASGRTHLLFVPEAANTDKEWGGASTVEA